MELIKSGNGQTHGYLIEVGDKIQIHNPTGKLLGFYWKSQDRTYKSNGSLVGNGNQLTILLEN